MSRSLIKAFPTERKELLNGTLSSEVLHISEFFYDTIQGEGINIGVPAAFLRLQGCTLNCKWCDTREVWRVGNPYTFEELFEIMSKTDIIEKLENGQHLVITGGSPLKQQLNLIEFIEIFIERWGFKPYIEIENECVVRILPELSLGVDCWNNSPKLSNSGNREVARHKPATIKQVAAFKNSWFKFVVTHEEDWKEIQADFLTTGLINIDQVILMPQGQTDIEMISNGQKVVELAVKHGVRYSSREHLTLWNQKTGV